MMAENAKLREQLREAREDLNAASGRSMELMEQRDRAVRNAETVARNATTEGESLREQLREAERQRNEAQKWMRFIADTQHRLLEAFKLDLSDDEWNAFADVLGIPRALSLDTTEAGE